MKKVTEKALRQSIAHWVRLRDGKERNDEEPYSKDCALCQRFCKAYWEGSYNEFGNFSSAISGTVRRHYLAIIIFSLLNIVIVVFIFRLLNKKESL